MEKSEGKGKDRELKERKKKVEGSKRGKEKGHPIKETK